MNSCIVATKIFKFVLILVLMTSFVIHDKLISLSFVTTFSLHLHLVVISVTLITKVEVYVRM